MKTKPTLIELLVVAAILSIIVGLFMNVFKERRYGPSTPEPTRAPSEAPSLPPEPEPDGPK